MEDADTFRKLLPILKHQGILKSLEPEAWGIRAYCLREGKEPAGLFMHFLSHPENVSRITNQDFAQGIQDRDGDAMHPADLSKDELIKAMHRHIGQWLPGDHEVLPMGIQHRQRGLLGWEKLTRDEVEAMVADLRGGRRGEKPKYLGPKEAAKALGGESLSELLKKF